MSPEVIAATSGVILSLIFNYLPGLNTAFDRLSANGQRLCMAGLLALTAIGMTIWQCTNPDAGGVGLCLGGTNWRAVVTNLVFALIANQGADRISPKPRTGEEQVTVTGTAAKTPGVGGPATIDRESFMRP